MQSAPELKRRSGRSSICKPGSRRKSTSWCAQASKRMHCRHTVCLLHTHARRAGALCCRWRMQTFIPHVFALEQLEDIRRLSAQRNELRLKLEGELR